ncbi:MAG: GNAT family protein [Patescibacteria group bacterium]
MVLHGAKVILRPVVMADAERYARWLSDPAVHQFIMRRRVTLREERQWIRNIPLRKNDRIFAIDTLEGVHIGTVDLHVINQMDRCAVLGIFIGDKRYWNQGYGTDAMRTILRYGFQKLKLHRIELGVYAYNPRAIRVYEKLGFTHEGRQRRAIRWRNNYYDRLIMGILREEWLKRE